MGSLRRIFISFVTLFDILGFGITFIVMSNSSLSEQEDLIYVAESDGTFITVIAFIGVLANLGLAYVLWRGSLAARRLEMRDQPEHRSRITGE